MKHMLYAAGALLVLVGAGCAGTRLADSQLSPQEQDWVTGIKKNYPSWGGPPVLPKGAAPVNSSGRTPSLHEASQPQSLQPAAVEAEEMVVIEEIPLVEDPADTVAAEKEAYSIAPDGSLLVDSTEEVTATEEAAAPAFVEYTVQPNDSLAKIAQKYYGRQTWQRIADANAEVLKGSTTLKPGMKLIIPMP